jgi:hypothetical protein
VFFKTKIKPNDFADCLVRDHQAIFGRRNLDDICRQFDLHFRDEPSYIDALYELQAFGVYSIASGVRTQCGQDLRRVILTSLNERFAAMCGRNWEMMRHRVTEYEEFGDRAPAGGLAAKLIFDRPPGVVHPNSKEAFGLRLVMNASLLDAMKAVETLFKQYKFDAA